MADNYYFVGGEDHDFSKLGNTSTDTATTAARRSAYSRCSLLVGPTPGLGEGYTGKLSTDVSSFWITARAYFKTYSSNRELLSIRDSTGVKRLLLLTSGGAGSFSLYKGAASGSQTLLQNSSNSLPIATLIKIDINVVNYGASGTVSMYVDGTLIISYTGNIQTDSATVLSSFTLANSGDNSYWSEVIVSDNDTRNMSVVTLAPAANGNSFSWTGSYASVNEVSLDDGTLITSATVGDLAQMTVGSSGINATMSIKAVAVTARAARGSTGPQNVKMNVRTGAADYFSPTVALNTVLDRAQGVFVNNPSTSGQWAYSDLTAAGFNVGIRSET